MADDVFDVDPLNLTTGMPWQGPRPRELTPTEKIEQMASEPLETTGKPPSPEAVNEAKRIAVAAAQEQAHAPAAAEDETPPEPPFLIHRNKFGPGSHGVYLPDGQAVGIWLDKTHHHLTGEQVMALLITMGLEPLLPGEAAKFGKWRDQRIEAEAQMLSTEPMRSVSQAELARDERMEAVRASFLKESRR